MKRIQSIVVLLSLLIMSNCSHQETQNIARGPASGIDGLLQVIKKLGTQKGFVTRMNELGILKSLNIRVPSGGISNFDEFIDGLTEVERLALKNRLQSSIMAGDFDNSLVEGFKVADSWFAKYLDEAKLLITGGDEALDAADDILFRVAGQEARSAQQMYDDILRAVKSAPDLDSAVNTFRTEFAGQIQGALGKATQGLIVLGDNAKVEVIQEVVELGLGTSFLQSLRKTLGGLDFAKLAMKSAQGPLNARLTVLAEQLMEQSPQLRQLQMFGGNAKSMVSFLVKLNNKQQFYKILANNGIGDNTLTMVKNLFGNQALRVTEEEAEKIFLKKVMVRYLQLKAQAFPTIRGHFDEAAKSTGQLKSHINSAFKNDWDTAMGEWKQTIKKVINNNNSVLGEGDAKIMESLKRIRIAMETAEHVDPKVLGYFAKETDFRFLEEVTDQFINLGNSLRVSFVNEILVVLKDFTPLIRSSNGVKKQLMTGLLEGELDLLGRFKYGLAGNQCSEKLSSQALANLRKMQLIMLESTDDLARTADEHAKLAWAEVRYGQKWGSLASKARGIASEDWAALKRFLCTMPEGVTRHCPCCGTLRIKCPAK